MNKPATPFDADREWMVSSRAFWLLCRDPEFAKPIIAGLTARLGELEARREQLLIEWKSNDASVVMFPVNEKQHKAHLRIVTRELEKHLSAPVPSAPAHKPRWRNFMLLWAPVVVGAVIFNLWAWS